MSIYRTEAILIALNGLEGLAASLEDGNRGFGARGRTGFEGYTVGIAQGVRRGKRAPDTTLGHFAVIFLTWTFGSSYAATYMP